MVWVLGWIQAELTSIYTWPNDNLGQKIEPDFTCFELQLSRDFLASPWAIRLALAHYHTPLTEESRR